MEVQELYALKDSIECLKNVEKQITKVKENKADLNEELNNMQLGRKTLKSIWKTITGQAVTTDELMRRIEGCDKEIEDLQKLRDYLIQYIPQVVFPKFKRERGGLYFKFLVSFADSQATNSMKNVEIWTQILENCARQRVQEGKSPDESMLVVKNVD